MYNDIGKFNFHLKYVCVRNNISSLQSIWYFVYIICINRYKPNFFFKSNKKSSILSFEKKGWCNLKVDFFLKNIQWTNYLNLHGASKWVNKCKVLFVKCNCCRRNEKLKYIYETPSKKAKFYFFTQSYTHRH